MAGGVRAPRSYMFAYFISVLVRLSKRWPWFFGFFLYGILNYRFRFEDRFFAWANDKLDERTPELVSMILNTWQQAPPLTVPIIGTLLVISASFLIVAIKLRTAPANGTHIPEDAQNDWTERKQVEIYVLANASANLETPTTSPTDQEPQLTRLRELRDAIENEELDAQLNLEKPMWSTVTLRDFEQYVAATSKFYWQEVLHRWQARQDHSHPAATPDWKIGQAMDYVAEQLGYGGEEDIDKKYQNPAMLLTSKAASGDVELWGKRMVGPLKAESVRRKIEKEDWKNRELTVWASQPYVRKSQTTSIGHGNDPQGLTDLYVNEAEIRSIEWQQESI